jgi:hypothetical protein
MILCEQHAYVWHPTDKVCPHCAKGEYSIPEGPTLKLAFEVERLRAELHTMTEAWKTADGTSYLLVEERDRLRADNLQLVNDLEAEGARLGMLRADLARVTRERDALVKAAGAVKEAWKGMGLARDDWQTIKRVLVAVQEWIAACTPPASEDVKP